MKKLRAFKILLLFIALFSAAAYVAFGGYLSDLLTNLRTGGGDTRFQMAVRGGDGNIYAFGDRDGPRLVGLNEKGRLFERNLSGLPKAFQSQDICVTQTGAVLISLYEKCGDELYYALYAAKDGSNFEELLRKKCEGESAFAQRRSVMISEMSISDSKAHFFLKYGNKYDRYAYDPQGEAALLPEGPFLFSGDYGAGIVADGAAYVATEDGKLFFIGDYGAQELPGGGIITKMMSAKEGFWYIDAKSGALVLFDVRAQEPVSSIDLLHRLPAAPEDISWLSVNGDELLILEDGKKLYSCPIDAPALDLTPLLYRPQWESGAMFAVFMVVILFLAFACWYLFSEVRKLYFPIVLRNALTLGLLAAAVVFVALHCYIRPTVLDSARSMTQTAFMTCAAQTAASQADLDEAARRIGETNADLASMEFFSLSKVSGEWRVQKAMGNRYAEGYIVRTPGTLGYLAAGAQRGVQHVQLIETPDVALYCAFAPVSQDSALVAVLDATTLEASFACEADRIAFYLYGCAGAVVLLVLLSLAAVTRGLRRITKGVDILAAGQFDVLIVQNSGDELSALAGSFNTLADILGKNFSTARRRSESFMQFVPQQLVTLLGARAIEEIDKSTASSRDMSMMVVWLGFPENVYQSDPETLFDNINEVIGRTSGVVAKNGGTVYNFTYHGYDAVFNTELEAVSTAVAIRQEIIALNDERQERGNDPVTLRVALDKGNMIMGVVGDDSQMVPTVVSACLSRSRVLVNLAHKLEANILCTLAVAEAAPEYALRYIGKATDAEELRVYEIFDGDAYDVRTAKEATREQFSEALYLLYGRDFTAAKRLFMDIARRHSGDGVARFYLYLADKFEKEAPEAISLN